MCGIVGYIGNQDANKVLLEGLKALEYRGYDSAGLFTPGDRAAKSAGSVDNLALSTAKRKPARAGIAHTRWATHGAPTVANAHPHTDNSERIWVVHNGIIENFGTLKDQSKKKGNTFSSDTDTEVIAHLIAEKRKKAKTLQEAVTLALKEIEGAYGLVVMDAEDPETIVAARMGSPLVLGIGAEEFFVASDVKPIIRHTNTVVYLEDGDCAILTPAGYTVLAVGERPEARIDHKEKTAEKEGFEHFMLKEVMEGPDVVRNTIRGRINSEDGTVKLGGLELVASDLRRVNKIVIVGCGTAYYAGCVGEYMIEEYAGIPVEVEVGSEFRYRSPVINEGTVLIAVSQSGETADTLEAVREAKRKGALTLGIVNTVGSTIARETDAGVYNHAGPEISVASTKAFISQVVVFALLAVFFGRTRSMSRATGRRILQEIEKVPHHIHTILTSRDALKQHAAVLSEVEHALFIGRKYNFSTAYEGALKLKEISYIHAEAYGAGEMKHGPLALIDEAFPSVAIALRDGVYEKMISNIQEIKARSGFVLALTTIGNKEMETCADRVIYIPKTLEMLSPILAVVPLQLIAYYAGTIKGYDVDKPRNLAKSVTVE